MANPKIKSSAQNVKKSNATASRKPAFKNPYSKADLEEIFRALLHPATRAEGELEHINPFTLVVAVALSAQATDVGVNKATRALFAVADTPQKMLDLGEDRIRDYIKTIGLYRNKAKNVVALSEKLIRDFDGEVPQTREKLMTLPGVGRKTANVVLSMAFGQATLAVDTHIFRIANRLQACPRQNAGRSRTAADEGDPRSISLPRASLADPAWALCAAGPASLNASAASSPTSVARRKRPAIYPRHWSRYRRN